MRGKPVYPGIILDINLSTGKIRKLEVPPEDGLPVPSSSRT
jgi:hypothetical protein